MELRRTFQRKSNGTKYFLTKIFSWKFCWSCSTIVTIQKNEFYCFKISFFSSAKHFRQQKQRQNIFWQNFFHGDFFEIVQQLWPTKKNKLYCLKISFLVQQSISGNKSRDKIFSDKNCSWKFRWSRSTIITKKEMSSNPWLCHFRGLTKHIRKDLMGLALQSFYNQNGY